VRNMLTKENKIQFREEGYFILENVFPESDIQMLTNKIDVFVNDHEKKLEKKGKEGISRANEISFTAHLAEKDPFIKQFVMQQKMVQLNTELLGPDISLYWDQAVYKGPEAARDFPWHQDNGYTPVDPEEYITCWLALGDATVENGCVWIMPKSHLQGTVEHKNTEIGKQCYFGDDPGVPVPLKKGSMVVFSSLLFHRSGANQSNHTRKGYIMQYTPADAKHGTTGKPFDRLIVAKDGKSIIE
jgi:phytanoyl-CoA hydroxylase